MESKFTYKKIPGGKGIRLEIEYDSSITKARITGDFFLFPEESILKIEEALVGISIPIKKEDAKGLVEAALKKSNASLVGVSAEDIAEMLVELTR